MKLKFNVKIVLFIHYFNLFCPFCEFVVFVVKYYIKSNYNIIFLFQLIGCLSQFVRIGFYLFFSNFECDFCYKLLILGYLVNVAESLLLLKAF